MSLNVIESPWCLVGAGMEHSPSDFIMSAGVGCGTGEGRYGEDAARLQAKPTP